MVNKELVRGIKIKLDHVKESWVDELLNILWSYHTTPQEGIEMTLFHGGEVVILIEIQMESARINAYNEANAEKHLLELDLEEEARDKAIGQLKAYKQQMC